MKHILNSIKVKKIIIPIAGIVTIGLVSNFTLRGPVQDDPWKAPASADAVENPFKKDAAATAEGKKIYETVCSVCHGLTGIGDGAAAANLKPKPADHTTAAVQKQSDGAIFWKLTEGRGQMASYEDVYTEKERWALVNFIRTLNKSK